MHLLQQAIVLHCLFTTLIRGDKYCWYLGESCYVLFYS